MLIVNWMRCKNGLGFLGLWEELNNPNFNLIEFDKVKQESGLDRFIISVGKWVSLTGAIGLVAKSKRYGGETFAHIDITLAFCTWLNPPFKSYLVKEFQKLKEQEAKDNKYE